MQRYCSELTEKLLKSLDKEYNVSKAECGVSRRDAPRRLRVRTRKRLSGHSRSPVRGLAAACTSDVRECPLRCPCVRVVAWRPRRPRVYECRRCRCRRRRRRRHSCGRPRRRRVVPVVVSSLSFARVYMTDTMMIRPLRTTPPPSLPPLAPTLARAPPSVRAGGESERARG